MAVSMGLLGVERHADVGPVLARAHAIDLHQIHGVVHQVVAVAEEAAPVAVDPLDDDGAAALQIFD
jgi:hypothetical protein